MRKADVSRRKFLGRAGTAALAVPLAAAIPAAIDATSPKTVEAASMEDDRQLIPNRTLPNRSIGSTIVTVTGLPLDEKSDASVAIQSAIDSLGAGGGTVIIPRHDTHKDSSGNEKPGGPQCVYMLDTT
ncbi:MAG TPA: twin-arginine translocation signal domain-containing protein, partial [Candidatus Angelobacter sp.]|nr:twin-arginine translocation signal domain-containing protein [Candidatus Angelobacter sp.]